MEIGRKLYYEKATGYVVLEIGERQGSVVETTTDQDFLTYEVLSKYNREQIGQIQLSFGDYNTEFTTCTGFSINPITEEILFDFTPQQLQEIQEQKYIYDKVAQQEEEISKLKEDNLIALEAIAQLYEMLIGGNE